MGALYVGSRTDLFIWRIGKGIFLSLNNRRSYKININSLGVNQG